MKQNHVLVVDDEPDICSLVREILEDEGFAVSVAGDGLKARAQAEKVGPDLVLLDVWMPDEDGISLLRDWRGAGELPFPVIVMSGHGTIDTAVEATRLGASAFIEKPLTTAKLLQVINHVLPGRTADRLVRIPAGTSTVARELRECGKAVSRLDAPLMIYGPPGGGKTDFAFYVHTMSARAAKDFVVADEAHTIADLPPHDSWGSLLIKNVSMHSSANQRAITDFFARRRMPPGLRLMATDERDLPSLIKQKTVNAVLAGMLEGRSVFLPPLSERSGDIPDLIGACVDYHCRKSSLPYRRFSIPAQNFLLHHSWPGNVRELDALVVHILQKGGGGQITLEEVRVAMREAGAKDNGLDHLMRMPLREAREAFERAYLEYRLREAGGSVTRLAAHIGLERTNLYRKLRALGIKFGTHKEAQ